jgi:MFS family permease
MVFLITVMLWIATEIANGPPWAPAAVSGALIASAGPALVIGPFAGVWVDRWNRRRIMLTADAARFVLIACLLRGSIWSSPGWRSAPATRSSRRPACCSWPAA